ncbi:MAG: ribose 5-phosphate isomerase B [Clostridia bacterium]|nr:ribose 5-phosphate isomerase B [Clostridia bacterium]
MMYAIGSDHAGYDMRMLIKDYLEKLGEEVLDMGTFDRERSNYPEIAESVASLVAAGKADAAVLICGTGIGMSIAANKVKGVRAACVSDPFSARMSKEHNDANVLCFGARVVGSEVAKMIVREWHDAEFLGGRHRMRLDMIEDIEGRN